MESPDQGDIPQELFEYAMTMWRSYKPKPIMFMNQPNIVSDDDIKWRRMSGAWRDVLYPTIDDKPEEDRKKNIRVYYIKKEFWNICGYEKYSIEW